MPINHNDAKYNNTAELNKPIKCVKRHTAPLVNQVSKLPEPPHNQIIKITFANNKRKEKASHPLRGE